MDCHHPIRKTRDYFRDTQRALGCGCLTSNMVLLRAEGFAWSSLLLGERLVYSYLNNGAVGEQNCFQSLFKPKRMIFVLEQLRSLRGGADGRGLRLHIRAALRRRGRPPFCASKDFGGLLPCTREANTVWFSPVDYCRGELVVNRHVYILVRQVILRTIVKKKTKNLRTFSSG